jgi:osmotically-inducible protein OsmY
MRDDEIGGSVTRSLKSDEALEASPITVSVQDGVVTLVGAVDSYTKKRHAEAIARRVEGVGSVVNELEVVLPSSDHRADQEIARAAMLALELTVPGGVKLSVDSGWVTLDGTVERQDQKDAAAGVVGRLVGVKGITNLIGVSAPQPSV